MKKHLVAATVFTAGIIAVASALAFAAHVISLSFQH